MTTRTISQQTRYAVEHRFYAQCEDPMCHTKHKNIYAHVGELRQILDYIVCDKVTSEVLLVSLFRESVEQHLQSILTALTDAEWQQITRVGA